MAALGVMRIGLRAKRQNKMDDAMQRHLQNRQKAWDNFQPRLQAANKHLFESDGGWSDVEVRPGRQEAFRSRNARTFQSRQAAEFVFEEIEIVRKGLNITRVPALARNKFLETAMGFYPHADQEIVLEHLRRNRF
ncbi:MAG: hypothetical protein K5821_11995 [Nitrobacter sp.]|uniref:hypothetical protein n=1 Tax=Nitrobacter sp. TaxID=29420 RepID=UPI00260B192E|nr:hypothetical protein [Nitrobacter sp.]MCV0387134.1 hypothetical protein [Nitrobacter sp.]